MSETGEFQRYLEEVTGQPVRCGPLPAGAREKLPLFLPGLYELQVAEVFGRRWVLAVQQPTPAESPVPSQLAKHVEQLRVRLGMPVVLVLTGLTPYVRRQLIRQGIPFVAPGRQVFLPLVWVDLRERYPRRVVDPSEALSAGAQVVVLFHLLKGPVDGLSLRELAGKLGYSAMTLSKAADELVAAALCQAETKGRSRMLQWRGTRQELWEKARPLLRSPVHSRHWVAWPKPPPLIQVAGLTALARLTLIADDPLPVYAMRGRDFREFQEKNRIPACPGPDEATAQVECWNYDPALLSDENTVDRLSLILSLADSPDERVQQALQEVETSVW